jgi:hypothetical protein
VLFLLDSVNISYDVDKMVALNNKEALENIHKNTEE